MEAGEFLAMGGYAFYVWAAFGFALVAMLALLLQSWHAAGRRRAELEELRRRVRRGELTLSEAAPDAEPAAARVD